MTTTPLRAAVYARCSTDEKKQDVEVQLKELRRYCEAYGWQHDEFFEYGSGYQEDKQPRLDELVEKIRLKHYDVLVVHNIDRFSRQAPSKVNKLLDEIVEDYKCRFIAIQNGLDSNNEMMWHWVRGGMTWFAHSYSRNLSDKIKKGIARKKELGAYAGGRPFKAVDWATIESLRAKGLSLRGIANEFNLDKPKKQRISFVTVKRLLQKHDGVSSQENEAICGVS